MINNNCFSYKGTDETDNGLASGIYNCTLTYNVYKTSL